LIDASVLLAWLFAAYQSNIDSFQVSKEQKKKKTKFCFSHNFFFFFFFLKKSVLFWLMCQFSFGFMLCVVAPERRLPNTMHVCLVFTVCLQKVDNRNLSHSAFKKKDHVVALRNGEPLLFNATRRTVETIYHRHTETTSSTGTPMSTELTESALQQLSGEHVVGQVYAEALAPADTITNGNMGRVLDAVLHRFVDHFVFMPLLARQNFCNLVARLCLFGFVELKSMPDIDPPLHGVALVVANPPTVNNVDSSVTAASAAAAAPALASSDSNDELDGAVDGEGTEQQAASSSGATATAAAATAAANDADGVDEQKKNGITTIVEKNDGNESDDDASIGDADGDDGDDDDDSAEREMARLAAAALQERHLDLDKSLLQCFVEGVHIAVFDKDASVQRAARAALFALHKRAVKLLDAKLLLSTNALLHSLARTNPQN
jgi:hypothetical protein